MSRFYKSLVHVFKRALRVRGLSYTEVAAHGGIPISTFKRLMTSEDGPLGKLEQLADSLGIDFAELCKVAASGAEKMEWHRFSLEQETLFVKSPATHHFFSLISNVGLSVDEVLKGYEVSIPQAEKMLRDLEAVGLIRRGPERTFRLNVPSRTSHMPGGPLQKAWLQVDVMKFVESMHSDLEKSRREGFVERCSIAMSKKTYEELIQEVRGAFNKVADKAACDQLAYPDEELVSASWYAAIAPHNVPKPWAVLKKRSPVL